MLKKSSHIVFLKRLLLFVILFVVLLNFLVDHDFGWHVAIGEYFLNTGQIIKGDVFSWTLPGYFWGNSYFIYQILIAFLLQEFGLPALATVFAAIGALGFMVLVGRLNLMVSFLVVFTAILARANLGVRPHTISFLFFALLLWAISKKLYNRQYFPLVSFCLFALWANIHRGFVFALAVLGLFIFFQLLETKSVKKWAVLTFLASFLGTFLTPFTYHIWTGGIINDLLSFENQAYVAEWLPTAFFFPINIIFTVSGIIFIYIFLSRKKDIDIPLFIVGSLTFALAFVSVSLVFFWAALFTFVVSRYFDLKSSWVYLIKKGRWFIVTLTSIVLFALLLNTAALALDRWSSVRALKKSGYPVDALAYLKSEGIGERLFNEYDWGGFLIWQYPQVKVFVDGRMASWKKDDGESILKDYLRIYYEDCDLVQSYDIQTFLVKKNYQSKCLSAFRLVYADDVAKVLIRN